jgi:ABC-type glutathione transport system ATPase component
MSQRVMIALALARGSRFLLADEPTSALDPTIAAEVLDALRGLVTSGIGILLVTHDLRVLPGLADELLVMDRGRIVEKAHPDALLRGQLTDPASARLLEATRRVAGGRLG